MNLTNLRGLNRMVCRFTVSILALLLMSLSVSAESPSALYKKGEDLEARQDYESAYKAYEEAWRNKPKDVKYQAAAMRMRFLAGAAHIHRGQQLRDGGKLEDALAEFLKAAAIDPSSFIASQEIQRTRNMMQAAESAAEGKSSAAPSFIQRRLARAATEPVELAPISNQPITLKMTEDSKLIYETVGNLAGINVLFDPEYTSKRVHIGLNGVTFAQALRFIAMESKTFWRAVTPNTIFVAADTPAKRKDLEESVIKSFYLTNFTQAAQLQTVAGALKSLLDISRITPIPELGAIVVRATPDQLALADKIINDLDKGQAEVVVDVAVVQVTRDRIKDLGTDLPNSVTVYPISNTVIPTVSTSGTTATTTTAATTTSAAPSGTVSFGHINGNTFALNIPSATANFLFSDGNTRVIQNPQIRVADGKKATLKIGDRVPIATGSYQAGVSTTGVSPLVNTQFQYIDVGVNIDVTPSIHADRSVTLKISMDVSSVTGSVNIGGISQPIIGQRRIDHEIHLKEGEVNLLAGILENSDIKAVSGYPGLSNIPILKYLFSDQHTEKHQNEVVFLITPHIVHAPEVSEANLRPLQVGTGNTIELQPIDEAPAAAVMQPAGAGAPKMPPATPASAAAQQTQPSAPPAASQLAKLSPPVAPGAVPAQGVARPAGIQASPTSGPVQLSFNPPQSTVTVGKTFTVEVMVSNAQDVSTPIQLQYDPQSYKSKMSPMVVSLDRHSRWWLWPSAMIPRPGRCASRLSVPPTQAARREAGP